MKIVALIARILLGLAFLVFGLNGFLHFIPNKGPMPTGPAGLFVNAMLESHLDKCVAFLQVVGGLLLLINRYVPLGLTLLGPIIVVILLFHILMMHTGLPMGIIVAILWFIVFYRHRQYFSGIFVQKTA